MIKSDKTVFAVVPEWETKPTGLLTPAFLRRTALATAIALTSTSTLAESRYKIRLQLDDEISSRVTAEADPQTTSDRLAMDSLIQSDPDPLYIALEERYQALPPLSHAVEQQPEQILADRTSGERVIDTLRTMTDRARTFTPRIRSTVRFDEFDEETPLRSRDYSTVLTTVNPTFEYQKEQRKWRVRARYDLEQGRYFADRDDSITDHTVDADWTYRLAKDNEFQISSLLENRHDRRTKDPIIDFDSSVEAESMDYKRSLINFAYRNGSQRQRSRYHLYYFNEQSDLEADDVFSSNYRLSRNGIGGVYTWQARRQLALVAEGRYHDFNYDVKYRDNDHIRALVGTDVLLGRRIRANLRLGYEQKEFDLALKDNSISKPVWRGSLHWALRRKTTVSIETGREIFELVTLTSPIDNSRFNVQNWFKTAWEETWSDKLKTEASLTYRDTDLEGRGASEDATQVIVSAIYNATNKLTLALDGAYTREKSDLGTSLIRRTLTFRTDYSL